MENLEAAALRNALEDKLKAREYVRSTAVKGAGHSEAVEKRIGADWRGAPHNANVALEPPQKHLLKRGSLTVLERVD